MQEVFYLFYFPNIKEISYSSIIIDSPYENSSNKESGSVSTSPYISYFNDS